MEPLDSASRWHQWSVKGDSGMLTRVIEGLDDSGVVAIRAVQTFELDRIGGVGRRRPCYADRIVAEPTGDWTRGRSQRRAARRHPGTRPDARFLDNEIILAQTLDRGRTRRIGGAVT